MLSFEGAAGSRHANCGGSRGQGKYRSGPGIWGGGSPQSLFPAPVVAAGVAPVRRQRQHLCFRKSFGTNSIYAATGKERDGDRRDRLLPRRETDGHVIINQEGFQD